MQHASDAVTFDIEGRRWRTGPQRYDLSIPLAFDAPQPVFFGLPAAREQAVSVGGFKGDVRLDGSCNCSTYSLTPHCNGTHTECVGHLTRERLSVRELCTQVFSIALLINVQPIAASSTAESSEPKPQLGDFLLTRAAIEAAVDRLDFDAFDALIIRTLPNPPEKRSRNYDCAPAPFFSSEAMQWIVARNVKHLVVDLPSVDRANDEGRLTAHRIFWNVPPGITTLTQDARRAATITELAFIDDSVAAGPYLLNLQVAPFEADAAPSRPIVLPLTPA